MLTHEELDRLVNDEIDRETSEMLELAKGGAVNGNSEQVKIMGTLAIGGGTDCISRKDVLQD